MYGVRPYSHLQGKWEGKSGSLSDVTEGFILIVLHY